MTDLENDILDHLCCAVESEMANSVDFDAAYARALHAFCADEGLKHIQSETHLLLHPTYCIMKKVTLLLGFITYLFFFAATFVIGVGLANQYNWAFMDEVAFVNQYVLCLAIIPLYWFNQYRSAVSAPADKMGGWLPLSMYMLGFLCSEALANAIFFKLMHLPGGNQLFILAALLGFVFAPFYWLRKYRLELK